jgi:hypothetical protein
MQSYCNKRALRRQTVLAKKHRGSGPHQEGKWDCLAAGRMKKSVMFPPSVLSHAITHVPVTAAYYYDVKPRGIEVPQHSQPQHTSQCPVGWHQEELSPLS